MKPVERMAYIGFDLDETLGRFGPAEFHTYFLQPQNSLYGGQWSGLYGTNKIPQPIPLSSSLRNTLDTAFQSFVTCLAEKERRGELGLLRPEILPIAKRLYQLKQTSPPLVKSVVIYSNNGNLALLHLASKLIEHLADTPGLFSNHIHWFHPSRRLEVVYGRPGSADKTLTILLNAFQQNSNAIDTNQVYFIDDIVHPDIQRQIGNRYIQVAPYKYDAPAEALNECFKYAFESANLATNEEYFKYLSPVLQGKHTFQDILKILINDQRSNPRKTVKLNNARFKQTMNAKFGKYQIPKQTFLKAMQTLRKGESKLNTGSSLTNAEQEALVAARTTITNYENQNETTNGGSRRSHSKTQKHRRAH